MKLMSNTNLIFSVFLLWDLQTAVANTRTGVAEARWGCPIVFGVPNRRSLQSSMLSIVNLSWILPIVHLHAWKGILRVLACVADIGRELFLCLESASASSQYSSVCLCRTCVITFSDHAWEKTSYSIDCYVPQSPQSCLMFSHVKYHARFIQSVVRRRVLTVAEFISWALVRKLS